MNYVEHNGNSNLNPVGQFPCQVASHLVRAFANGDGEHGRRNAIAINRKVQQPKIPHLVADTAGDGTDMRATQSELQFTPSRRLHAAEAVVQRYGASLGCDSRCHWRIVSNRSHSETFRARMTALFCQEANKDQQPTLAVQDGRWLQNETEHFKLISNSSYIEIKSPTKEKSFHVAGDESSMETDHNEQQMSQDQFLEVCALGDHHDEWLDKLTTWMTSWNTRTMGDADRRKVLGHGHRLPFRGPSEESLVVENRFLRLDQANHCATTLRGKRVQRSSSHTQDHNVLWCSNRSRK